MGKFEEKWNSIFLFLVMIIKLIINLPNIFRSKRKLNQNNFSKVLVLGNGPSLQKTNIKKLVSDTSQVICVNFFPSRDERFFVIKPKFLCLLDPAFFGNASGRLNKQLDDFHAALEKVDWDLNVVCVWGKKLPVSNKHITYIYLNNIQYKKGLFRNTLYLHNLANPGFQNVVIGAIYFAIIAGATEILLAGVDNSEFKNYKIDEKNRVYCEVEHHYGEKEIIYCDNIKNGEFYKRLYLYYLMFEQYYLIADYAKRYLNTNIINVNPYSYVDVFEKTSEYYNNNEDSN